MTLRVQCIRLDGDWTPLDERDLDNVTGTGALFPMQRKLIPECKIARILLSLVWRQSVASEQKQFSVLLEIN